MKHYDDAKFKKDLEKYYDSLKRLEKHGVHSKVVGDIGEQFAKRIFGIRLMEAKSNPSVDGVDRAGKRVQIKTRHRHMNNPTTTGFQPFDRKQLNRIDYALLVILNEKFWVDEIWKVDRKVLREKLRKTKMFTLTERIKMRKGVTRVYP